LSGKTSSSLFRSWIPPERNYQLRSSKCTPFRPIVLPTTVLIHDYRQIERIIEQAGSTSEQNAIGTLTSDNRDFWTDNREKLLATSPVNAASLEAIESAMVVVCLDDTKPVTREDISWACWVGDGQNRFYDKHQRMSTGFFL